MATTASTSPTKPTRKTPAKRPVDPLGSLRAEATELEDQLEKLLWSDAILAARDALQSLQDDESSGHHFDRRRGLRLRDKAIKVDAAFNRLRALRRGELLPMRSVDEF